MALNGRQQAFVDEYLRCWNASEAAQRAGYSEATAYSQGQRLLKHVEVSAAIQERVSERAMSADEVLIRLAEHARGSMADFVEIVPGVNTPFLRLDKAHAAGKFGLVKKLKYTTDGGVEFELYDAQAALVQLGKVHKLFTDKQDVSIDGEVLRVVLDF